MTIEKTIRDHLVSALALQVAGRVYFDRPSEPTLPYVEVERTGGRIEQGLRHATLAVRSVAASLYDALVLNDAVIGAMIEARTLDSVASVYLNSDYNFSDKTIGYRYQAVFDITYYDD